MADLVDDVCSRHHIIDEPATLEDAASDQALFASVRTLPPPVRRALAARWAEQRAAGDRAARALALKGGA